MPGARCPVPLPGAQLQNKDQPRLASGFSLGLTINAGVYGVGRYILLLCQGRREKVL